MSIAELLVSTTHSSPAALLIGGTQVPQRDLSDMGATAMSTCTLLEGPSHLTGTYFLPSSSISTVTGPLSGGTSFTVAL